MEIDSDHPPSSSASNTAWIWCSQVYPRRQIVFFSQVLLVYILVLTALVNITIRPDDTQLWVAVISGAVGYLLPNPKLEEK